MATENDLASLIAARRRQLDGVLRSDLVQLEVRHGSRLVEEAVRLADQMLLADALTASGREQRQRQARLDQKAIQKQFRTRGSDSSG
jgi:hypothetical protein